MRSNLTEAFKKNIDSFKDSGAFNINDLVQAVREDTEIDKYPSYSWLLNFYFKCRVEALVSSENCYSFKRNMFVALDNAKIKQLFEIDRNFKRDIEARQKTLERIRQQEDIAGQYSFNNEGEIFEEQTVMEMIANA